MNHADIQVESIQARGRDCEMPEGGSLPGECLCFKQPVRWTGVSMEEKAEAGEESER